MRCKRIGTWLVVEEASLPPFVVEHLSGCEPCRRLREQTSRVRGIIALKKHEMPPAGSEERMVRAVHQALAGQWAEAPRTTTQRLRELFLAEPLPALRYAAAALLLFLMSIHTLKMPELGAMESFAPIMQVVESVAPDESYAVDTTDKKPIQTDETPVIMSPFQAVSNRGGGFMQYGPLQSIPVSFDY